MHLAITGSRTFTNYDRLEKIILNRYKSKLFDMVIVSGGARGADNLAERFAKEHLLPMIILKPDWKKHGVSAGFYRNQQIVDKADEFIAFWDDRSKGTQDLIKKVQKACKPLKVIHF